MNDNYLMILFFWISLFLVFYTYIGYGLILYVLVRIKRVFSKKTVYPEHGLPDCTLIIAAYNEADIIREKIRNTLDLNYPKELLKIIFVTDGSDDKTPQIIAEYPQFSLMHLPERTGKVAAVHRAVMESETSVLVLTDANTILNYNALINLVRHFKDPQVGAVAGEKRLRVADEADAGSAGEGFYWQYESALKKWDSELFSVVGAAGELFSIRRELYQPVSNDTILDDFMISMNITEKGFRISYEPEAYAMENASENIHEELKRKIRIAAGGIQSIIRLKSLLNPFKHGILSFQYISHRVLRWTVCPILLIYLFISNSIIVYNGDSLTYQFLLFAQIYFYILACLGYILEKRQIRFKPLFIPYYFCMMNYAVLAGMIRYFSNNQSAIWEKARRKT